MSDQPDQLPPTDPDETPEPSPTAAVSPEKIPKSSPTTTDYKSAKGTVSLSSSVTSLVSPAKNSKNDEAANNMESQKDEQEYFPPLPLSAPVSPLPPSSPRPRPDSLSILESKTSNSSTNMKIKGEEKKSLLKMGDYTERSELIPTAVRSSTVSTNILSARTSNTSSVNDVPDSSSNQKEQMQGIPNPSSNDGARSPAEEKIYKEHTKLEDQSKTEESKITTELEDEVAPDARRLNGDLSSDRALGTEPPTTPVNCNIEEPSEDEKTAVSESDSWKYVSLPKTESDDDLIAQNMSKGGSPVTSPYYSKLYQENSSKVNIEEIAKVSKPTAYLYAEDGMRSPRSMAVSITSLSGPISLRGSLNLPSNDTAVFNGNTGDEDARSDPSLLISEGTKKELKRFGPCFYSAGQGVKVSSPLHTDASIDSRNSNKSQMSVSVSPPGNEYPAATLNSIEMSARNGNIMVNSESQENLVALNGQQDLDSSISSCNGKSMERINTETQQNMVAPISSISNDRISARPRLSLLPDSASPSNFSQMSGRMAPNVKMTPGRSRGNTHTSASQSSPTPSMQSTQPNSNATTPQNLRQVSMIAVYDTNSEYTSSPWARTSLTDSMKNDSVRSTPRSDFNDQLDRGNADRYSMKTPSAERIHSQNTPIVGGISGVIRFKGDENDDSQETAASARSRSYRDIDSFRRTGSARTSPPISMASSRQRSFPAAILSPEHARQIHSPLLKTAVLSNSVSSISVNSVAPQSVRPFSNRSAKIRTAVTPSERTDDSFSTSVETDVQDEENGGQAEAIEGGDEYGEEYGGPGAAEELYDNEAVPDAPSPPNLPAPGHDALQNNLPLALLQNLPAPGHAAGPLQNNVPQVDRGNIVAVAGNNIVAVPGPVDSSSSNESLVLPFHAHLRPPRIPPSARAKKMGWIMSLRMLPLADPTLWPHPWYESPGRGALVFQHTYSRALTITKEAIKRVENQQMYLFESILYDRPLEVHDERVADLRAHNLHTPLRAGSMRTRLAKFSASLSCQLCVCQEEDRWISAGLSILNKMGDATGRWRD